MSAQRVVLGVSNNDIFQREMSKFRYFELGNTCGVDKFQRRLLAHENNELIMEISEFTSDRSMFVGNTVSSNGSVLNFFEIDPLFLALPFLQAARGQVTDEKKGYYKQLDDIFKSEDNANGISNSLDILLKNKRLLRNLKNICQSQQHDPDESLTFFRLDDAKLKTYLDERIEKAEKLYNMNETHLQHEKLATSEKNLSNSLCFAFETIFYDIPSTTFNTLILQPRDIPYETFINFKKQRDNTSKYDFNSENIQESNEPIKQSKKSVPSAKNSTNDIKNQQAAKNTKSISSFFTKK